LPGDTFTTSRTSNNKQSDIGSSSKTEEVKNSTNNASNADSGDSDESDVEDSTNNSNTANKLNDEDAAIHAFNESKLKAKAAAQAVHNNTNTTPNKPADIVKIEVDPKKQIRRGEAMWVAGQWFRVDSRVRDLPLSEQPARAQARPSVVMLKDLSKKNDQDGYMKPFTLDTMPLDSHMTSESVMNLKEANAARNKLSNVISHLKSTLKSSHGSGAHPQLHLLLTNDLSALTSNILSSSSILRKRPPPTSFKGNHNQTSKVNDAISDARSAASNPYLLYSQARRHGCSKDVRDMYFATRADVPTDPLELYKVLKQTKLIEENELMCRPPLIKKRMNVDNDGKPKKRRYYERKNQRFTNWHLHGTEIGAALAAAAERQQKGESVGDGGM